MFVERACERSFIAVTVVKEGPCFTRAAAARECGFTAAICVRNFAAGTHTNVCRNRRARRSPHPICVFARTQPALSSTRMTNVCPWLSKHNLTSNIWSSRHDSTKFLIIIHVHFSVRCILTPKLRLLCLSTFLVVLSYVHT